MRWLTPRTERLRVAHGVAKPSGQSTLDRVEAVLTEAASALALAMTPLFAALPR
jgi:hypothetical protein